MVGRSLILFKLKCFKKFEQFKKEGKTILFVTHNVSDVLKNCNKANILDKGKKIFDGDVDEAIKKLHETQKLKPITEEVEEEKEVIEDTSKDSDTDDDNLFDLIDSMYEE